MKDCCWDNLDNYKKIGRGHLVCPVCESDITLAVVLQYKCDQKTKAITDKKNVKND